MKKTIIILLASLSIFLSREGINSDLVCADNEILYLKINVHGQKRGRDCKASYTNWTNPGAGHFIVPVNTGIKTGPWFRGFCFVTENSGKKIFFEFDRIKTNISVNEYLKLITSPDPEPVSIESFSDIDQKGIKDGKAYIGMTKEGVRTALGHPAPHLTPALDYSIWTYWTNRFKRILVEFDENGKVILIE